IRIDQNVNAIPLEQEATLSEPPQAKSAIAAVRGMNVCKQRIVGLDRLDHGCPSSLLTRDTPATIFASFCRAAQRAVWLRPQCGAKESFSAGAYLRHRRTRSATSLVFSM